MSLAAPPSRPTPRPRVSRHRYRIRRLGALTVLVAVGAGAAKVVSTLADDGGSLQPGSGVADAADGSADPAATAAADDLPSRPRRPRRRRPRPSRHRRTPGRRRPTNPAVVLIAGDSDAGTFAPYLDRLLADTDLVDTALDYKVSSGLARPDYFDWSARLHEHVPVVDPDIVVITFGGNDAQGLLDATVAWSRSNRCRIPTTPSGAPSTASGSAR